MQGGRPGISIVMTKRELQRTIDRMVGRIVEQFHPDRVILFGSHARGTAGPDSDVNLPVLMPVAGSKREKQLEVRRAMHEFKVSKDIIVTTPEDFEWRKEIPGTIEQPASREGKVVYARVSQTRTARAIRGMRRAKFSGRSAVGGAKIAP